MDEGRSFRRIVEDDLWGRITEAEQGELEASAEDWRAELVELIQDLDKQLAQRRAAILPPNNTPGNVHAYNVWKGGALGRKKVLISRLSEVREIIKAHNVDNHQTLSDLGGAMLQELKAIRAALERK